MRKTISAMVLTQMLVCGAALGGHEEVDPYALEPCMNGGVSESGLFASQAEEDALAASIAAK